MLWLLHASVTVNVTMFSPTFVQLKSVTSRDNVTPPQESDEPLSISDAEIEALPLASNSIVISEVKAVGSVVSSIVNVAIVVDWLPHSSVAVNITVAAPVEPHKSLKPL